MMTDTELSSRLNASPFTFACGKSTNSPAITSFSPYTRAMPSPTSSTRPDDRTSVFCPAERIRSIRMLVISPADCLSSAIAATRHQGVAEGVQAGADGRVVHPVADLHHQTAEQLRLDADG